MAWPIIKKYWKYLGILLLGILSIILYVMVTRWLEKRKHADDGSAEVQDLQGRLDEIGSQLKEAEHQAAVEVAVARSGEEKDKKELKETVALRDKTKRRERLVNLYSRVSR